jgi:hypothetical protein
VPRYPDALQIYRILASSFWQVRYFIDGKYIRKSTGTDDKAVAITFAKQLFDSVRLAEKLDQQKHPHTFSAAARKFLQHQGSLVKVGDIDFRNQNEDQKKLDKDVLPFFGTMDVSAITKQTINEYLASLADRILSKSTRNKHVGVIRKVLKYASDAGILKSLPMFPAIGQDANPRAWFDRNEYRKLRQAAQSYAKSSHYQQATYSTGGNTRYAMSI